MDGVAPGAFWNGRRLNGSSQEEGRLKKARQVTDLSWRFVCWQKKHNTCPARVAIACPIYISFFACECFNGAVRGILEVKAATLHAMSHLYMVLLTFMKKGDQNGTQEKSGVPDLRVCLYIA